MKQYEIELLDADGEVILTGMIGSDKLTSEIGRVFNGKTVASERYSEAQLVKNRRVEQLILFSRTLHILDPIGYREMDTEQQERLAIWRREWLDYPETGTKPTTDVSDLF